MQLVFRGFLFLDISSCYLIFENKSVTLPSNLKCNETMRSFASDNNSGVHPLVMAALIRANTDHAFGYGDDKWSEEAVAKIKDTFTLDGVP